MRRRRRRGNAETSDRDLNDPAVHTPGTFIDSWFNMPGAQVDDDERPSATAIKGTTAADVADGV